MSAKLNSVPLKGFLTEKSTSYKIATARKGNFVASKITSMISPGFARRLLVGPRI